jgi:hypothetical protein
MPDDLSRWALRPHAQGVQRLGLLVTTTSRGDEIFLDPDPLGTLRERDRVDKPAIVQSGTTVWRMR